MLKIQFPMVITISATVIHHQLRTFSQYGLLAFTLWERRRKITFRISNSIRHLFHLCLSILFRFFLMIRGNISESFPFFIFYCSSSWLFVCVYALLLLLLWFDLPLVIVRCWSFWFDIHQTHVGLRFNKRTSRLQSNPSDEVRSLSEWSKQAKINRQNSIPKRNQPKLGLHIKRPECEKDPEK